MQPVELPRARRFTPTRVGTTSDTLRGSNTGAGSPPRAWGRRLQSLVDEPRQSPCGSPPRAWGQLQHGCGSAGRRRFTPTRVGTTRSRICRDVRRARFTPTRVGTTARRLSIQRPSSVHPHARGDDARSSSRDRRRSAVHPHARGDDASSHAALVRHDRFTPTRVGTTTSCRVAGVAALRFTPTRVGTTGHRLGHRSPPRAWGHSPRLVTWRFTPTRVGTTRRARLQRSARYPVHPHARGDDCVQRCYAGLRVGSPPRAWGRRPRHRALRERATVHPHARGDDCGTRARTLPRIGSPPRAWGRRRCGDVAMTVRHGSPPRAWGQRRSPASLGRDVTVHPHARGDDAGAALSYREARFTPTRVGTTASAVGDRARACHGSPPRAWGRRRGSRPRTVHPHARGDDLPRSATRHGSPPRAWGRPAAGSSRAARALPAVHPHARGDDADAGSQLLRRRSTPTRVGTTTAAAHAIRRPSVHPHARGDDNVGARRRRDDHGPPPRAWGRRPSHAPRAWRPVHPHARGDDACDLGLSDGSPRSTPTRVGTTRRRASITQHVPVHPHARGDDSRPALSVSRTGPPPRAWGRQRRRGDVARSVDRSTPTRVGTTPTPAARQRAVGPPPRAWGRRSGAVQSIVAASVHPHARGDDARPSRRDASSPVHPHARGDDTSPVAPICLDFQCSRPSGCVPRGLEVSNRL